MSATTSQANSSNAGDFFNLHTCGIGYLNRVRHVPVKGRGRKAEEFLACSIAAMRGPADDVSYTYFDCRVSGTEAQEIVESLAQDVEQERKVLIGFCIGDIYTHLYERDVKDPQGRKTGEREWASLIKGRLLRIDFVTINGERVYTRKSEDADGSSEDKSHPSRDQGGDPSGDELPPVRERDERGAGGDSPDQKEPNDRNTDLQGSRQDERKSFRESPKRRWAGRESEPSSQQGQRESQRESFRDGAARQRVQREELTA